nr:MAG TPA: hypothetical protein [Caudoviricetes sp.]
MLHPSERKERTPFSNATHRLGYFVKIFVEITLNGCNDANIHN